MFREKLIVEGVQPEKALLRLQKAGIDVFHAKKIKKNQILFTVSKKDSEKVFAIYPKMWYNISEGSAYFCQKVGEAGLLKVLSSLKKHLGLLLGALVFLAATLGSDGLVLSFSFEGAKGYESSALAVFEKYGVKRFAPYPKGRENELCAELMKLEQITFASVKKRGTTVCVELRASAFSQEGLKEGAFLSPKSGKVVSLTVLRGTPKATVGQTVQEGEVLVEEYLFSPSGERVRVCPIAKVTLLVSFKGEVSAQSADEAIAKSVPEGCVKKQATAEKTEHGFFVQIDYEYTEGVNF